MMKKLLLSLILLALSASSALAIEPTDPMEGYQATEISRYQAREIFKSLNGNDNKGFFGLGKSICSNRAMVWAYEAYKDYGVKSKKLFIHYSEIFNHIVHNDLKVCNRFCDGWDYHVATIFNVEGKDMAMDKKFLPKGPVTPLQWTNNFIAEAHKNIKEYGPSLMQRLNADIRSYKSSSKSDMTESQYEDAQKKYQLDIAARKLLRRSKRSNGTYDISCKEVTHIMDADLESKSEWCHIQRTNMYYWTQISLRMLNVNKEQSTRLTKDDITYSNVSAGRSHRLYKFDLDHVRQSARQAFSLEMDDRGNLVQEDAWDNNSWD